MKTANPTNKLQALDILQHDKALLKLLIKEREERLERDFIFIRDNSSKLLMSGVTSLLSPSKSKSQTPSSPDTMPNWLSIGKDFLPVLWEIAQPLVLTWGINKAKGWLREALGIRR